MFIIQTWDAPSTADAMELLKLSGPKVHDGRQAEYHYEPLVAF